MRAHQPGSTPIDIPETVPNPAYTPAPGACAGAGADRCPFIRSITSSLQRNIRWSQRQA